ncbi:AMP-binding protein [Chryseobacterium carnipullorum]|uniref:AMP-binding protein n=1 Tax=Chryseobacterium carnipullorum TaxID=1124835 RepID=A0A376DPK8_CHRCU|nr:AMP-binding protein [Chryseobacterium carnipullorum]MDN5422171.1 AMP-binding protein [Chryseobacterium sp.]AZA48795.1 AMP-binding protein [Chryseobacterium carnipullorum]AZA63707.1 AMP-binding protein [Chryseobacterium carnipullorum]MDN5475766.1 AMP-binding protein [Chryseobacterium sp.]STC93218.1 Short-chain-fatty-acid--CoA ligase [Chryseobacterium carnipullorum]
MPLSYVYGASSIPLLGQTIGGNLKKTVEKYPNQEALVCVHQNYRATYQEFYNQTTAVAKALIFSGAKAGDRIGIWSSNRYEWVLLQYATARIGTILVNINPAYRTHELTYVINQSGIRFIFSSLSFKTSNYKELVEYAKEVCPSLEHEIFFDDNWEDFLNKGQDISDDTLHSFEDHVQFDDAVNIQYTSGTTGFPKGVTLSHHNILNNGYSIGVRLKYSQNDRVCIPVPFYHCFGMVIGNICCTAHGACMVIPNDSFDPDITLKAVSDEKCTSLYGVPTMFIAELAVKDFDTYDFSNLRTGVMAGSVCPPEIMKKVENLMNIKEMSICYGMTETSPVSTQTLIGTPLEKQVSTVGTVQDHLEIKIIDENGKTVERGEHGELCTRGYSVMLKYWNDPENTKKVLDDARWMHTGDMAVMDDEGYITISGRIKDLIIRGGENISPKEIEDFLYTYVNILDVQIIGIPSEKYGEEIMAWVKVRKGFDITEAELLDYCKGRIAHYKIPKYWKFVDEFPMTISGKIRKVEMREISIKELELNHFKQRT